MGIAIQKNCDCIAWFCPPASQKVSNLIGKRIQFGKRHQLRFGFDSNLIGKVRSSCTRKTHFEKLMKPITRLSIGGVVHPLRNQNGRPVPGFLRNQRLIDAQ